MILLLYFIYYLKNDVEIVDDFYDCKEIFYFNFFIEFQFSFTFAFDGTTFLKSFVIIYIVTVLTASSINFNFFTEIMKLLVLK